MRTVFAHDHDVRINGSARDDIASVKRLYFDQILLDGEFLFVTDRAGQIFGSFRVQPLYCSGKLRWV